MLLNERLLTKYLREIDSVINRGYYRKALAKRIEDSDKRYNLMLMNSPFTFAVLKGKEMIIELANDKIKEVWEEEMI
jgi:hypothetical protein